MNNKKLSNTITIGIDLGTTNSAIAISRNGNIELIKRGPGEPEYTPSVFGINSSKNKEVGQKAYQRLFRDASDEAFVNYKAEVKRLMGTADTIYFERIDKSMTPEEISAEILISLKEAVKRKYPDFSTMAAVITIPAFFSALQSEATKRAGELAGFKHVVLLQEPIAAAMAYGLNNSEDQNWLVYDLGGGTFDVAIMSSKDGILTVLGQNGDNHLGGKDFDFLIVDEIIIPAIVDKYNLKDFNRNNVNYKAIFDRLKAIAEAYRIELSFDDKVTIDISDRVEYDDKEIIVLIDFTRKQFEELIKPSVQKTLDLAKKTLKESGVKPSSIAKILLVGGPTQIPYVREALKQEFNCEIDFSVDPLTIVAKGACVYGLSQRLPLDILKETHKSSDGKYELELHYDAMTAEEDQTITGKIEKLKDSKEEYNIQIQSESNLYNSSKIRLKNGKFHDEVTIEKGKTNTYWIYLFDKDGNTVPVFPDSFTITQGLTPTNAPIPHTIGVIYAKKSSSNGFKLSEVCFPFFDKGSITPLSKTEVGFKTIKKLKKGEKNNLPIKLYQGDYSNPINNIIVTELAIEGSVLPYNLPEGTELDITISIDKDMSVSVEYYIPSIDKRDNARVDKYSQKVDTKKLAEDLRNQKELIKKVENKLSKDEKDRLDNSVKSLEKSIKNADNDTDERMKSERDMQELKSEVEKIEEKLTVPQLSEEFHEKLDRINSLLEDFEDETERNRIAEVVKEIKIEGEKAITSSDKEILVRLSEQLQELIMAIHQENPTIWIYWLNNIKSRKSELSNQTVADHHIGKAEEAVESEDFEELKLHVRSLFDLLPEDAQDEIGSDMAGITR